METLNFTAGHWRDIVGYEGAYQIPGEGEVCAVRFNRLLKFKLGKLDYHHVSVGVGDKAKTTHIYQLAASTFLPIPEGIVTLPLTTSTTRRPITSSIIHAGFPTPTTPAARQPTSVFVGPEMRKSTVQS